MPQTASIAPALRTAYGTDSTDTVSKLLTPQASTTSDNSVEELVVLTPCFRVALWLVLFVIVFFNTLILTVTAVLYFNHDTRGSPLWYFWIYFLTYHDGAFLRHSAPTFTAGYTILAALFGLYTLQLVYISVKRRGFHFGPKPAIKSTSTTVMPRPFCSSLSKPLLVAVSTSRAAKIFDYLDTVRRLVSVDGPYFDHRRLADDTLELLSQTGAAYASSRQISNVGLNLSYGFVMCLTSLCPLIYKRIYRGHLLKQRMACIVTDLVLDFVWGTVLPLWTAVPVIELCVNAGPTLEVDNNMIAVARQIERVVILSWTNYALSVIPFVTTLLNLIEVQSVFRGGHDTASIVTVATLERVMPTSAVSTATTVDRGPALTTNTAAHKLRYSVTQRRRGRFFRAAHAAIPLYGITALVITLAANRAAFSSNATTLSCVHRVYPWFMTDEACVGRRINCSALGITGTTSEIEHALDQFTPRLMSDLLLVSCPKLTIPHRITQLNLQTLLIYDSHIVEWDDDTALIADHFPTLINLQITKTSFGVLPAGLIAHPLPPNIYWIHLERIPNATELLTAVGANWDHLQFFNCINCGLTEFPFAIKAMRQLTMLALIYNDILHVPEDWNVDPVNIRLDALWIDANKMATFPDSLWRQTATTQIVSAESTGLREVPEWVADVADPGLSVYAANSPLCADPAMIPERVRPLIRCTSFYF